MTAKTFARKLLDRALMRYGYRVIHDSILHDWQKNSDEYSRYNTASRLPEGAESYLQINHPRLKELKSRYSMFDSRVTTPVVWKNDYVSTEDLLYFRGDNAYVWQLRGRNMDISAYALSAYYVKSIDTMGFLLKLDEDEFFGNFVFNIDNRTMSRDLLDSIIEVYFLERHLGLSSSGKCFSVLDIGAGYGRLAHRMLGALPSVETYVCTDAVAESTFISEYYLGFRNLKNRARVVPLNEIEDVLDTQQIDIAINIHSFSECRVPTIEWWMSLLAKHRVKYLMIVPNSGDHGGELLLTNERQDMKIVIEKYGYREIAKDPKYRDAVVQRYAVNPTCHFLFELR